MCSNVNHVKYMVDPNRKNQLFPLRSQKLGMDLFFHNSKWYIIVADYYSKYPWIYPLLATSSKDVISALKFCFSDFGIPRRIICDNGPQFTSREYQDFAAKYGFKLTTSSPFIQRVMVILRDRYSLSKICSRSVMRINLMPI